MRLIVFLLALAAALTMADDVDYYHYFNEDFYSEDYELTTLKLQQTSESASQNGELIYVIWSALGSILYFTWNSFALRS
ncbi:CLUMA_CG018799, isoform A [Clunio marinus]|uniref:CLUMA_CG018799, isoform A n=1 Tax=Clunio marinus TaxID=568069 RepID=A0A1J1IZT0_9DIPT|nr:CLUMA_CG018799, isoform A [Clunio marinus]